MADKNILGIVARTHPGRLRRMNNDRYVISNDLTSTEWRLPIGQYDNSGTGSVMALAGGMGGSKLEHLAAEITIESIKRHFNDLEAIALKDEQVSAILKDAFLLAHQSILHHITAHPETKDITATLMIGWVLQEKLFVCWSGTSRCYHYRPGEGLQQLSRDHSLMQSLIDQRKIRKEEAVYYRESKIVTQCLGSHESPPSPDIITATLAKNDIILMCSDGLNLMLTDKEIEETIRTHSANIHSCANSLIEKANAAGGMDNITVILLHVFESAGTAKPLNSNSSVAVNRNDYKEKVARLKWLVLPMGMVSFFVLLCATVILLILPSHSKERAAPPCAINDTLVKNDGNRKVLLNFNFEPEKNRAPGKKKFNLPTPATTPKAIDEHSTIKNGQKILQKGSFIRADIRNDTTSVEQWFPFNIIDKHRFRY